MVKYRTVLRGLCLLCLGVTLQAAGAEGLQIQAARTQVELGQPFWLTLTSNQTAVSLATLDLRAWRRQVVMPRDYDVNLDQDDTRQVLRLRVYPLHTGQLILPALHFLQHTTPALQLTVLPALDPATRTPIDFSCTVSSLHPWQQQQVTATCSLNLHDRFAVFNQAADAGEGIRLLPMQLQKRKTEQRGLALTYYQLGWVLLPSRAGTQQLQLPPIEYMRDGVVVRRFYVPPLTLTVQALPAWLPGTIPVGKVSLIDYRPARSWLKTSVLSQLHLQLRLSGVAQDLIPAYAGQLHSDRRIAFYRDEQHQVTRVDAAGLQHDLDYTIPLVAKHIGIYRLPDLRLQYFDPDSGTLETRLVPGPAVVVINTWLELLVAGLVLSLGYWLGRKLLRFAIQFWRRYRTYQLALQMLKQPVSVASIKQVMQTMALAEGWRANLSYLQWQARMQAKTVLASKLAVAQLNAASYGRRELSIADIVSDLTRICRQRRIAFS